MNFKVLFFDPQKCNGCGDCEKACSLTHTGETNPIKSRVRVINLENDCYLPMSCQQCEDSPCRKICPNEAIYKENDHVRIVIDYSKCVGCRMCVFACPFGAMKFHEENGRPYKCDLCEGEPVCVGACEPGAVIYKESHLIQYPKIREKAAPYLKPFNFRIPEKKSYAVL